MQITLPGFDGKTFSHIIDNAYLKFLILEASSIKKGQGNNLRLLKMQLRDRVVKDHPELTQYYYSKKAWYSGFAYFSQKYTKGIPCGDFLILMTEIPEQRLQNFPESELEKLTRYLKDDQKKLAICQMIKDCNAPGLTQLVFSNETNDGVGSFRGKFIETILFHMINESLQVVNGEGINTVSMQHPYYCGGSRYGKEIDAVFAFYNPQQIYKMLEELQARNKCITCKIGNRIKA